MLFSFILSSILSSLHLCLPSNLLISKHRYLPYYDYSYKDSLRYCSIDNFSLYHTAFILPSSKCLTLLLYIPNEVCAPIYIIYNFISNE